MSSPRTRQGPSPPTVEQILEDLSAASDQDVVFKSPVVAEQTGNATSHSKDGEFGIRCIVINFGLHYSKFILSKNRKISSHLQ